MEKIKILYFIDTMGCGGIQQFALEIMKKIDKDKFAIDFLLLDDGKTHPFEETLNELNIKIYKLKGIWLEKPLDFIKYCKALDKFFKEHHDYKIVHMHSSSKNFMVLKLAKKYGIKIRIAHSHSTGFASSNKLKVIVGNVLKKILRKYTTHCFACSKLAGKWLFGDEEIKLIHNGVDYEKFKINQDRRKQLRKELGIDDNLVIGNVGRLSRPKNQIFLIDIFNEIHKKNKNTILMLVGAGEKEQEIREKVEKLNLTDQVKFMGFCDNTNELMWCMDVFLLPSLYEGLPVVGVEAQSAGLPCFMSKDVITDEVKITENVTFIELNKSAEEWAEIILDSDLSRKDTYEEVKNARYLIEQTVEELENFYIS